MWQIKPSNEYENSAIWLNWSFFLETSFLIRFVPLRVVIQRQLDVRLYAVFVPGIYLKKSREVLVELWTVCGEGNAVL